MDLGSNETKQFTMDRLLNNNSTTSKSIDDIEFASHLHGGPRTGTAGNGQSTIDNAVAWFAAFHTTSIGPILQRAIPCVCYGRCLAKRGRHKRVAAVQTCRK